MIISLSIMYRFIIPDSVEHDGNLQGIDGVTE